MGVDEKLHQEQADFRLGRGPMEQIFTLGNILEQCMKWQAPIHVNFVDFRKAFDSSIRQKLWVIKQKAYLVCTSTSSETCMIRA